MVVCYGVYQGDDFQASLKTSEQLDCIFIGGYREGGIPDPIPNSEVKSFIADGTAHKSVGEQVAANFFLPVQVYWTGFFFAMYSTVLSSDAHGASRVLHAEGYIVERSIL